MNSVTFFGEVNELNSRAIWWSDSDSEDNQHEDNNENKDFKVLINTNNDMNCDSIYISLAKNDKTIVKELTKIGFITIDGLSGIIANIFAINETSIWIQLNANYPTLKNHLLVKTIANLLKQIFIKCHSVTDKSVKPLIQIISKDLMTDNTSNDLINYLSNNNNNVNIFPKDVKYRALLAPKMITNSIESSIFEYCTVFNMSCIALILPHFLSTNFNNNFIPKQILTTIQQFNDFSDSNIFI